MRGSRIDSTRSSNPSSGWDFAIGGFLRVWGAESRPITYPRTPPSDTRIGGESEIERQKKDADFLGVLVRLPWRPLVLRPGDVLALGVQFAHVVRGVRSVSVRDTVVLGLKDVCRSRRVGDGRGQAEPVVLFQSAEPCRGQGLVVIQVVGKESV